MSHVYNIDTQTLNNSLECMTCGIKFGLDEHGNEQDITIAILKAAIAHLYSHEPDTALDESEDIFNDELIAIRATFQDMVSNNERALTMWAGIKGNMHDINTSLAKLTSLVATIVERKYGIPR